MHPPSEQNRREERRTEENRREQNRIREEKRTEESAITAGKSTTIPLSCSS
jgi:hypothetical protein